MTAKPRDPAGRLAYIDEFRGLAALFVVMSHIFDTATPHFSYFNWLYYGKFAVAVFIMLSGYCLALPVLNSGGLRRGAINFYLRRAWRILPAFYAAVAISAVLGVTVIRQKTGTEWDHSLPVTAVGVLANLLMLQDIWRVGEIDYPLWSIAVESNIYLIFPLLVTTFISKPRFRTFLPWFAGGYIVTFAVYHVSALQWLAGTFPYYTSFFAVGVMAAAIGKSCPKWFDRFKAAILMVLVSAFGLICFFANRQQLIHLGPYSELFPILIVATLLVHFANRSNPSTTITGRESSPLAFAGSFSYSLYLIHAPIIQLVWQYGVVPLKFDENENFGILIVVGTLASVIASYVFFLLFERFSTKPPKFTLTKPATLV